MEESLSKMVGEFAEKSAPANYLQKYTNVNHLAAALF